MEKIKIQRKITEGATRDKIEAALDLCNEIREIIQQTPGPSGTVQEGKAPWEKYAFRLVRDKADLKIRMAIIYLKDLLSNSPYIVGREYKDGLIRNPPGPSRGKGNRR